MAFRFPMPPALQEDHPGGEHYEELWLACAGPLASSIPHHGDKVMYFPQGHMEQVSASTNQVADHQMPQYNLPPQFLCRVVGVQLRADPDSDEVNAQLSLIPESEESTTAVESENAALPPKPAVHMFSKTLTASDTSTHGGFSIHRKAAEECLPPLNMAMDPPAQELIAKDLHGTEWHFRHIYRGHPKRHLLTTGWSVFVSQKRLSAGDVVIFLRGENGELRVGIRRAVRPPVNQQSSLLSSDSMHMGVVATAWHAIATRTMFSVIHKPRVSQAEFVIPLNKYNEAIKNNLAPNLRFSMKIETESTQERRYTGTVISVGDLDSQRWKGSKWRCLKVSWDEQTIHDRPSRVSPWEIEPCINPPAPSGVPSGISKNKRYRGNSPYPGAGLSTLTASSQSVLSSSLSPKPHRVSQGQEIRTPLSSPSFVSEEVDNVGRVASLWSNDNNSSDSLRRMDAWMPLRRHEGLNTLPIAAGNQEHKPETNSLPIAAGNQEFKVAPPNMDVQLHYHLNTMKHFSEEKSNNNSSSNNNNNNNNNNINNNNNKNSNSNSNSNSNNNSNVVSQLTSSRIAPMQSSSYFKTYKVGESEGNPLPSPPPHHYQQQQQGSSQPPRGWAPFENSWNYQSALDSTDVSHNWLKPLMLPPMFSEVSGSNLSCGSSRVDITMPGKTTVQEIPKNLHRLHHPPSEQKMEASNAASLMLSDSHRCKIFGISLTDASTPVNTLPVSKDPPRKGEENCFNDGAPEEALAQATKPIKPADSSASSEQGKPTWKSSREGQVREGQVREGQVQKQATTTRSCIKVMKKGCMLGRVLDLSKLDGYGMLFEELEKMFHMEGQLNRAQGWLVAYCDNEGDMLLLGDDPWIEFCELARKIIILSPEEAQGAGLLHPKPRQSTVEERTVSAASSDR